ncbi:class I SAM-dependent methyltransferase [Amycolatopsis saalfeldensis]|uniref:Methyltransferase domain-containing protein n=1 Tax=Amycolatopsis saalfeldensis TaxID=394193 RepID=A0A1H8X0Q2_9PSEU|nr:class I SAM-dependent methyltransferase [Amycolatopsis saalfeldensis]SEP33535.1 Methyltransferase domain-containing protein [Amycolatopsis saalfeldensis]
MADQRYEEAKRIPAGRAETATVLAAVGDLSRRSVLDVGCGAGFHPRLFRSAGASRVFGVDAARTLIGYAQRQEERDPLGISYEVHDALALPVIGAFDVVTALGLIGYAPGAAALDTMLAGLAANVRSGGRLVLLHPDPDADWTALADHTRYGLTVTRHDVVDGRTRTTVHLATEPPWEFESFVWPPGVVEAALARTGLSAVHRQTVVTPPGDEGFWRPLRENPTFAVLTATRP